MRELIERLRVVRANITEGELNKIAVDTELDAIISGLETLGQLEVLVENFETGMQETGGWSRGSDQTLAERVQRCIAHYTRMAAQSVSDSRSFKDGVVSWLRGITINAQSVSWASTHHEKDARLRGLIEVIETAITRINEQRLQYRLSSWNGVTDSWMKSDFPTREMRRRIFDLEEEIKRLRTDQ